jgi:hypothetical protein
MTEKLPELAIAGAGAHRIWVRLEPVPYAWPKRRGGPLPTAFDAVALTGADFNGSHDNGLSSFRARVYAPQGFEDADRDRCLLADFEFHHIVLDGSHGGRMDFTGVLVGAHAYPQEVYDRIAAGSPLLEIPALRGRWEDEIRYLPTPHPDLDQFLGWRAKIVIAPLRDSDQEN